MLYLLIYIYLYICICQLNFSWLQCVVWCVNLLRIYNPDFKMEVYLKIAHLFLEEQSHVSAEAYINRAALLQSEVKNKDLHTMYKVDYYCRFLWDTGVKNIYAWWITTVDYWEILELKIYGHGGLLL